MNRSKIVLLLGQIPGSNLEKNFDEEVWDQNYNPILTNKRIIDQKTFTKYGAAQK